jgi:hypothetical protein
MANQSRSANESRNVTAPSALPSTIKEVPSPRPRNSILPTWCRLPRAAIIDTVIRVGDLYLHLQSDGANSQRSSPPANWPDSQRMFSSQLDFLHFMADHKAFTLPQRVLHLVQTDFDFQQLPAVG